MIEKLAKADNVAWLLAGLAGLAVGLAIIAAMRRRARRKHIVAAVMREDDAPPGDGGVTPFAETAVERAERVPPLRDLEQALQRAFERDEPHRLAGLYLDLARRKLASGDPESARGLLLDSVRAATAASQRETHARARQELGEIAHAAGDLTMACEHWQIARKLFHETGLTSEHAIVEARMLANGCPTDWVLTDF